MAALLLGVFWLTRESDSLVVYCAHDSVYAEQVLRDFEKQTGIPVTVRYDTEASKSLGLINLIVQERHDPRCDVFWNNELLGTIDLKEQGLLEPYRGSGWDRLPAKYRDPDGNWVGFGARVRVVVVNSGKAATDADSLQNLVTLETSKAALAKPLFGTTLTHYTVLWSVWGPERLKAWHHELRMRGVREMTGNGPVKDVVASGTCDVGLTDTDDVFVALDDQRTVEMLPVRVAAPPVDEPVSALKAGRDEEMELTFTQPAGQTICIPNTAAIIRGTKRQEAARKLVDFLASAETELALAKSKSRQIPLGPIDPSQLPDEVRRMQAWADDGIDLRSLLSARRECLKWLRSEYVK